MTQLIEFIQTSFFHVFPILIAAAFAAAVVAERAFALYSRYPVKNLEAFLDKIAELVMAGRMNDAISLCDRMPSKPSAQVVKAALQRAHQPESLIENGLELAVGRAVNQIQKRTSFLATIANVATLLGLLGTIAGLIASFQAVGTADPSQKSVLLAQGISTAMNATMLGLGLAIPCMVAFSFLMSRTNSLVADVDQSAVQAMDILKQRYYSAEIELLTPKGSGPGLTIATPGKSSVTEGILK